MFHVSGRKKWRHPSFTNLVKHSDRKAHDTTQSVTYLTSLLQVIKHLNKILFEVIVEDVVHQLVEPSPVFVVHQTVVVDTEDLVDKQAYHGVFVLQRLLLQQQAALDDAWEVPQVERVVRLGWSWKQVLHGFLIHLWEITSNAYGQKTKDKMFAP